MKCVSCDRSAKARHQVNGRWSALCAECADDLIPLQIVENNHNMPLHLRLGAENEYREKFWRGEALDMPMSQDEILDGIVGL